MQDISTGGRLDAVLTTLMYFSHLFSSLGWCIFFDVWSRLTVQRQWYYSASVTRELELREFACTVNNRRRQHYRTTDVTF